MKREVIRGKLPPLKPRHGVMPTVVQRDRTQYNRKDKHKKKDSGCLF